MKYKFFIFILTMLLLTGCGAGKTVYTVSTQSITTAQFESIKPSIDGYKIEPSSSNKNSFEYDLVSNKVENIFEKHGIKIKNKNEKSRYITVLDFGISEPKQKTETRNVPIYGQTGYYIVREHRHRATIVPSYGITGYSTIQETYDVYKKWIKLETYDAIKPKNPVPLWKTEVISEGLSNDFIKVLPYLLESLDKYISTNTNGFVTEEIEEKEEPEEKEEKKEKSIAKTNKIFFSKKLTCRRRLSSVFSNARPPASGGPSSPDAEPPGRRQQEKALLMPEESCSQTPCANSGGPDISRA